VTGKRKTATLSRAAIQNVKQDPLARFHAHRLTVAEHSSIDGEGIVADLVPVRYALGQRCFHPALAGISKCGDLLSWREELHRHVAATA